MTFFKEQSSQNFDKIQPGGTYIIKNFSIRKANTSFNLATHNFELSSISTTSVEPSYDDAVIKKPELKIISLKTAASYEAGRKFNTIVIVKELHDPEVVNLRKTNESKKLTKIELIDPEMNQMQLSWWGDNKQLEILEKGDIVLFQTVRLNIWNESRSIAFDAISEAIVNPTEEAGNRLPKFIKFRNSINIDTAKFTLLTTSVDKTYKPITPIIKVIQESQELLEIPESKKWFRVCGYLSRLNHNPIYLSCSHCNKKMLQIEDVKSPNEEAICQKCGESGPIVPKFLASGRLSDSTGSIFINMMSDEHGKAVYDLTASEILLAKLEDNAAFSRYCLDMHAKHFMFKIVAQLNEYNGNKSIRYRSAFIESGSENKQFMNSCLLETLREILG